MKKKTSIISPLLLFLTAVIWGSAFVAQSVGMEYVGPFTFNACRSLIGAAVLVPCIFLLDRWRVRNGESDGTAAPAVKSEEKRRAERRVLAAGGVWCGIALFAASNLQQFGIKYTTVGKAGFITALYIVLVPVLGIFLKKKTGIRVWTGVLLAVAGLYLLCITDRFSIGKGDALVMLCSLIFAVHILIIDYYAPRTDGIRMSCIQFLVCGILSLVCMFLTESPDMGAILSAWKPIAYAGVFSCGVAYTLQIIGQKDTDPTIASLILSLESVVSVLAGWLLLGQKLSLRELCGCGLMFCAIILAQLPDRKKQAERQAGKER